LSIRILVFEGTLLIVFKFGSKAINEFHHIWQPAKLIHLSDGSDKDVDNVDDGKGNNFARSIKAGLSSVSMFT
jgi:hypothetical protein